MGWLGVMAQYCETYGLRKLLELQNSEQGAPVLTTEGGSNTSKRKERIFNRLECVYIYVYHVFGLKKIHFKVFILFYSIFLFYF